MRLILGLGNPGVEYHGTRHNVGFGVVEELSRRHGIALGRQRHKARFGSGRIGPESVLLAEPVTFMNLSGEAARPLMEFHGIEPASLIVVHDEADFTPGAVRLKWGGGTAGHKGLVSLVRHLGTPEFFRIRIGIGRPPGGPEKMTRWVLERPHGEEAELFALGIQLGADAVEKLLAEGIEAAMRTFHGAGMAGKPLGE